MNIHLLSYFNCTKNECSEEPAQMTINWLHMQTYFAKSGGTVQLTNNS